MFHSVFLSLTGLQVVNTFLLLTLRYRSLYVKNSLLALSQAEVDYLPPRVFLQFHVARVMKNGFPIILLFTA